jgi:hypothetical protein
MILRSDSGSVAVVCQWAIIFIAVLMISGADLAFIMDTLPKIVLTDSPLNPKDGFRKKQLRLCPPLFHGILCRQRAWTPLSLKGKRSLSPDTDTDLAVSSSQTRVPPPQHQEIHLPMATFEIDPFPWLPWGHQIIDGGVTRLP